MKILILKPSSLGDVIHALPVLRRLRRQFPHGEIYWWIESGLAPLLEADPDLTGIIRFERKRWAAPRNWVRLCRNVLWMRGQQFDWVIDLQCLARTATVAWLANGKLTIGLDEPREGARGVYDLIVRRASFHTHAVDWYLGVLPLLGVPVDGPFEWLPLRPGVAAELQRKLPLTGARWVVLQPGARWLNKRWPAEAFAELLRRLALLMPQFRFAILGGSEDRALGQIVARGAPEHCLDLTGRLSLPEMVECLRLSELVVSNDTGPMHVAAALGKPVIALFGPTEPRRTGPYGQVARVLQLDLPCVPCLRPRCAYRPRFECLRALSPETVLQAIQERLATKDSDEDSRNGRPKGSLWPPNAGLSGQTSLEAPVAALL